MKFFFTIFSLLVCRLSFSQNLLVNGGFEDENICSEYHANCSPEGWINSSDVPYTCYFKEPALAYEGKHCVAVEAGQTGNLSDRTYIRTQLMCKLRKGSTYKIEFYIRSKLPVLDSIGIYFTYYDFLFEYQSPQPLSPSLYVANGTKLPRKNDTTWQKVSLLYKANGTEVYLAIGNFSQKPVMLKDPLPQDHAFVFIDKVSMVPADPNELICNDWKKRKDNIYSFNFRHQYLRHYIDNFDDTPEPPALSKTSIQFIHKLILPEIFFESNESILTNPGEYLLDSLCYSLEGRQIDSLITEGHTDSLGSDLLNQKLSKNRALTVANYIRKKLSIDQRLVVTRGWASDKPVADNRTPAGRQRNRRVELFLYVR
jgi:outer membrane protein OmpA-like peptidoglycan-associated protein